MRDATGYCTTSLAAAGRRAISTVLPKRMMHTLPVVVQVCELIPPLGDYTQCIFEKGADDQESTDCWQVSRRRGAVSALRHVAPRTRCWVCRWPCRTWGTHGFTGSAMVSSISSILLVCSRMASKGLGSALASLRDGPPPNRP